jgi:hypothetical protein
MSATESDDAEAERYAAGRWELGNGQRVAVDYEPESMWFGLGDSG